MALNVEHALGVPHDIIITMLAQMYSESAARDPKDGLWKPGTSPLYLKANNPLCMKWVAELHKYNPVTHEGDPLPPFNIETNEFENGVEVETFAHFRHFQSVRDAMVAYALLIRTPRYEPAMRAIARSTVENPGWKLFALALGPKTCELDTVHCGYSTNPAYGANLIKLVAEFHLDDPATLQSYCNPQITQISQMEKGSAA